MFSRREGLSARFRHGIPLSHAFCRTRSMVLLLRIPFFRLPLTCCQDEEISSVVSLLTCFSSRCASRGYDNLKKRFYLLVSLDVEVAEPTPESHTAVAGEDVDVRSLAVT